MSKYQVSRLCGGLDEQVRSFRERPLEGAYPYLTLLLGSSHAAVVTA